MQEGPQPVIDDSLGIWYDFTVPPVDDRGIDAYFNLSENSVMEYIHGDGFNHTPESGYYQNGLNFDGIDDILYGVSEAGELDEFTIEIAVKIPSEQPGTMLFKPVFGIAATRPDGSTTEDVTLSVVFNITKELSISTSKTVIDKNDVFDRLLHIVMVQKKEQGSAYVNGNLLGINTSQSYKIAPDALMSFGFRFMLDGKYLKQRLYFMRMYSRPLTADEVQQNYESVAGSVQEG